VPLELDLTHVDPERLRAAVFSALERQSAEVSVTPADTTRVTSRLPSTQRLKQGAQETMKEEAQDARAAEYFQSLLELGYLVASADGLAKEEREALAKLVEQATESVVEREALKRHFDDLDGGAEVLGRRERLARVAANFEDSAAREEAIGFAVLIAIADGKLADPEARVLLELGTHFSLTEGEVESVLDQVVASIKVALEG
jgi:tellurite resistance protein